MVAISSCDVLLKIQSVKRGSPFTGNILHLSVNWGETGLLSILRRVTKENDERKRRKKKIWTWCEKGLQRRVVQIWKGCCCRLLCPVGYWIGVNSPVHDALFIDCHRMDYR